MAIAGSCWRATLSRTRRSLARNPCSPAFQEYGLPGIIRTDNGAPFATTALRRLSTRQRVVDAPGHLPRTHRARIATTERQPRTDASHAQGGGDQAPEGFAPGATASLQQLSAGIQRGAAPRESRRQTTVGGLSPLAARVPGSHSGPQSTRATTSRATSAPMAGCGFTVATSPSPRHSSVRTSGSKRLLMGGGPSISTITCWGTSTNERATSTEYISAGNRPVRTPRLLLMSSVYVLPISPAVHQRIP